MSVSMNEQGRNNKNAIDALKMNQEVDVVVVFITRGTGTRILC